MLNLVTLHPQNLTPPRNRTPLKLQRLGSLNGELPIDSNQKDKANLSRIKSSDLRHTLQRSSCTAREEEDSLSHHSQEYDQSQTPPNFQSSEIMAIEPPEEEERKSKLTKSETKRILIEKYKYAGLDSFTGKKENLNEETGICYCCDWSSPVRAPNYEIED